MKSNKKYFAIIGLLILVIIIAIVVLFTNSKKTIVENPTSEIETTNNDNVEDTSVDDEPTIPENIVEFTSQQQEQVDEIFPMKYCLYHKMASSNNFYICLGDYQVSEIDKANVDPEYIKFLEKYDGDMTLYQHCVILGRAVENEKLLDKLTNDFEITKITLKHT